jgi:transcriptional regulator with XRE-family HTH domain
MDAHAILSRTTNAMMESSNESSLAEAKPTKHAARRASVLDTYVGKRIKERREELSLSQEAVAQFLGVTFQQLQKYERGANRVSAGRLFELAFVLRVKLDFFFEGVEHMIDLGALPATENTPDPCRAAISLCVDTEGAEELLRAYSKIPTQGQRSKILQLIKVLGA